MQATLGLGRIGCCEQAAALFGGTFGETEVEELRVAHLDADRRLIALRLHGGGAADAMDLPIRSIMQEALVLRTHGLVIAHNHPSGDPSPSRDDIAATRTLAEAVRALDIRLYDHIIFGGDGWRSLHALGLM